MPIRRIKEKRQISQRNMPSKSMQAFRKVDLKRAIDGARRVGFEIGAVDIRPDGTITIRVANDPRDGAAGIFDQWEDCL